MPAIVAIPQVVEELLVQFADLFPNEPSRRHFAEYLTGLLVAEHKTVSGIAREFASPPDQINPQSLPDSSALGCRAHQCTPA